VIGVELDVNVTASSFASQLCELGSLDDEGQPLPLNKVDHVRHQDLAKLFNGFAFVLTS